MLLARVLKRLQPDIIHAHDPHVVAIASAGVVRSARASGVAPGPRLVVARRGDFCLKALVFALKLPPGRGITPPRRQSPDALRRGRAGREDCDRARRLYGRPRFVPHLRVTWHETLCSLSSASRSACRNVGRPRPAHWQRHFMKPRSSSSSRFFPRPLRHPWRGRALRDHLTDAPSCTSTPRQTTYSCRISDRACSGCIKHRSLFVMSSRYTEGLEQTDRCSLRWPAASDRRDPDWRLPEVVHARPDGVLVARRAIPARLPRQSSTRSPTTRSDNDRADDGDALVRETIHRRAEARDGEGLRRWALHTPRTEHCEPSARG